MAIVLSACADRPVDAAHVIRMLLVHDIVEIDAGDTYAYDAAGKPGQGPREQRAADRLFGLLPDDQAADLRALWDEFEAAPPRSPVRQRPRPPQPAAAQLPQRRPRLAGGGVALDQVRRRMAP